MLESPLDDCFSSVECLGVCPSLTFCLSLLGIIECTSHSHALVARCPALVFQYPLATIPFCLLGNHPISGVLDTNPGQLAQKGILPHRLIQLHCRFGSHLIRKGHWRTLFVSTFFFPTLLKQPKSSTNLFSNFYTLIFVIPSN